MGVKNQKWVWERYWQADRLASCFDEGGSNYPKEFLEKWSAFFDKLDPGAKVLDLCTGNGAIARMGAEFAEKNGTRFKIIGIDQAAINPKQNAAETPGQENIKFIGEVSAENLPFPDGTFNAVVSQYGLEYTDLEKTIPEIGRATEDNARVKLLCHSEESVQAREARKELKRLAFVLDTLKLHDRAARATEAVWEAEKGKGKPELARGLLKDFQDGLNALAEKARAEKDNPFFRDTYGLLRHTFEVREHFPLAALLEKIEDTKREALAHRGRVQALFDASLGPRDENKIKGNFEAAGFEPKKTRDFYLDDGEKLAGRVFEFRRLA